MRRALIIKTATMALIGLVAIGLGVAWLTSYKKNSDLIEQAVQVDNAYAAAGAPLIKQTLIADRDLEKVLPMLHRLRNAPAGYATRDVAVPLSERYGLSQHPRLLSASGLPIIRRSNACSVRACSTGSRSSSMPGSPSRRSSMRR